MSDSTVSDALARKVYTDKHLPLPNQPVPEGTVSRALKKDKQ